MRWYLLRDRRHEGPYAKEEIAEGVKSGKIDPQSYLLPEQAIKDQSSFAYISVADVLGPEFIFDHKKKLEAMAPKNTSGATFRVGQDQGATPVSKENLISEFEEGLESTQLVRIQKAKDQANEGPRAEYNSTQFTSFASTPSSTNKMPWIIGIVAFAVLGLGALSLHFLGSAPEAKAVVAESTGGDKPNSTRPNSARSSKNRVPTGRIQLPAATVRDEEDSASSFERLNDEEAAAPARSRSKQRAPKGDSEANNEESVEASSDTESFDQEEEVEEDQSEEVEDEADI